MNLLPECARENYNVIISVVIPAEKVVRLPLYHHYPISYIARRKMTEKRMVSGNRGRGGSPNYKLLCLTLELLGEDNVTLRNTYTGVKYV